MEFAFFIRGGRSSQGRIFTGLPHLGVTLGMPAIFALAAFLAPNAVGQSSSTQTTSTQNTTGQTQAKSPTHSTQDWSDQHVIFRAPSNLPGGNQAAAQAQQDPRFQQQNNRRNARARGFNNYRPPNPANLLKFKQQQLDDSDSNSSSNALSISSVLSAIGSNSAATNAAKKKPVKPQGDWSVSLGTSAASIVAPGMFPAKFSFDIDAGPICADDYIMFGINATGAQPTTASQTGTFTSAAIGASGTITIAGSGYAADPGSKATDQGTFTGNAGTGTVTITNGANSKTFNGAPAAAASATGTFTGAASGTITITNGANTLTMTANNGANGFATGTGTAFAQPKTGGSIVITNGANTLTLSNGGTAATASWTDSNNEGAGTTKIGAISYIFNGTTSNVAMPVVAQTCNIVTGTGGGATGRTNLAAAMTNPTAGTAGTYLCLNAVNTAITNVVSMSGTITFAAAAPGLAGNSITLTTNSANTGVVPFANGADGNNTCTDNTTPTLAASFATSTSPTTLAQNIAAALNSCGNRATAINLGLSSNTGAVVNLTANTAGSSGNSVALASTLLDVTGVSAFTWSSSTLTGGSTPNSCSGTTNGVYTSTGTLPTEATNLQTALQSASCSSAMGAVGLSTTVGVSSASVTITAAATGATGNAILIGSTGSGFAWNGGATHLSGGFPTGATTDWITSATTTTEATNLAAAINANSSTLGIGTVTVSGSTITLTASGPGVAGNNIAVSTGGGLANFTWATPTLTGGLNGQTTPSTFATTSGLTIGQIAANLATSINFGNAPGIALTTTSDASGHVTVFADTPGPDGNIYGVISGVTGFTWAGGTLTGGTFGQPSIVGFNNLYSGLATTASDTGTFTGNAGSGTVKITNGANSKTFTGGVAATAKASGTFNAANATAAITITNGANTLTMTANNGTTTTATGVGNVLATPQSGSITITNGSASTGIMTISDAGTAATNATVLNLSSGSPTAGTITIGSIIYHIVVTTGAITTPAAGNCNIRQPNSGSGTTNRSTTRTNLVGAITNPTGGSTTTWLCTTAANTQIASATNDSGNDQVDLVAAILGTDGNLIPISQSGTGTTVSAFTNGANGSTSCTDTSTPSLIAKFAHSSTLTTVATNIAAAINLCLTTPTQRTALNVNNNAVASGTTVTITAATSGTSGNSVLLASTLAALGGASGSAFTWNTSTMTGGASANTCSSSTAGVYSASATIATQATNLQTALQDASCGNARTAVGITNTVGVTGAQITITATASGAAGNSIAIGVASGTGFSWNAGATHLSGGFPSGATTDFVTSTTTATEASNLLAAINANLTGLGINTATLSGSTITLTASSAGSAGNAIAVSTGGGLTNFAWNSTTLVGGSDMGMCGPGDATPVWSYDTHVGTGGAVTTSPVLSLDGTKVAYVESRSTGGSVLHVLRPGRDGTPNHDPATEGSVSFPQVPTTVTSSIPCPNDDTSCDFQLIYNAGNAAANTNSSPYYDYTGDVLYVGDDNGHLWKITGVFNGTPALATGAWAAGLTNGTTANFTGPVFDFTTKNIYVGDDGGGMNYFRDTGSTVGSCSAPCFGARVGNGSTFDNITDPPIVDSSDQRVMFFGTRATSGAGARVVQTGMTLTTPAQVALGTSGAATPIIRTGALDDAFFNDPSTGHMFVCGHSTSGTIPTLYRLTFTGAGVLNTTTSGSLALGTASGAACSPLTEIVHSDPANPASNVEWLFGGVTANCVGGIAGGCIMAFDITGGVMPTTIEASAASPGGTSGIAVDNVSASGRSSSTYYSTLGIGACSTGGSSGGCAVQRTQNGLQ